MRTSFLVGAGAAVGALARFALTAALGGGAMLLLFINVAGSVAMGAFRPGPFWGKGVLGGFTSFATFALYTGEFSAAGAAAYVAATVVGCVGGWLIGAQRGEAQPSNARGIEGGRQ